MAPGATDSPSPTSPPVSEDSTPKPSTQRDFTYPESRMMKTSHGFYYAFNAQAVVDDSARSCSQQRSPKRPLTSTS